MGERGASWAQTPTLRPACWHQSPGGDSTGCTTDGTSALGGAFPRLAGTRTRCVCRVCSQGSEPGAARRCALPGLASACAGGSSLQFRPHTASREAGARGGAVTRSRHCPHWLMRKEAQLGVTGLSLEPWPALSKVRDGAQTGTGTERWVPGPLRHLAARVFSRSSC